MVKVGTRWHALRAILSIRFGPGAAILPSNVTRIHMEFARRADQGHFGPRRFWRDMLPRLKYYNPATPMIVNRKDNNEGAAVMSVYFSTTDTPIDPATLPQPPSSAIDNSKAPAPIEGERVVTIDMKNRHSEEILESFLSHTKAEAVLPGPEEENEIKAAEELRIQSEKDRKRVRKIIEEEKKEKAMLARARAEAGSD
ncbi:54S ribosomal protein MRP49, mitochondrial [Colletotrichum chlorophyti]|uniref:54S ribosomal protein MRP49, mitochondrial n=1 Tax=Colletotrichum chlorophyti TaxID=708187 RepID=A0A1Q8RY15_9PEZI|nr:54S ribosomal protein MRP49, mitochondrial [Colletotrichum chlorophyti]